MSQGGWSNDAVTYLVVPTGATTGQRIVILNPVTGDAVDVYDSANELIMDINSNGVVQTYATGFSPQQTEQRGDGIYYIDNTLGSTAHVILRPTTNVSQQPAILLNVKNGNFTSDYTLAVLAASWNGTGTATLVGNERGVGGSMVQSDGASSNNLMHCEAVTGTTDASGFFTFVHHASFTPNMIFTQVHDTGTPAFGNIDVIDGSITSTQATVYCVNFNGTARTLATVSFWIMCMG